MKRNIIKKNKQKYNERLDNKMYYLITLGNNIQLFKHSHKYNRIEHPDNAFRRNEFSKIVLVPIFYSAKVRRSRIKNVHMGSLVFRNIEQFNEKYNLQNELSDIPVKRYTE